MKFDRSRRSNLTKMRFRLPVDAWHGFKTEDLWVDQVATGKYRIENSPFFVKGISFEDIVAGIDDDENLLFDRVLIRGGHSTYRIIRRNGIGEADFSQRWKPIQDAGCSFESADFGYSLYTVDVPPTADASAVYELLELGESNDIWSFEEGHFGGLASE